MSLLLLTGPAGQWQTTALRRGGFIAEVKRRAGREAAQHAHDT